MYYRVDVEGITSCGASYQSCLHRGGNAFSSASVWRKLLDYKLHGMIGKGLHWRMIQRLRSMGIMALLICSFAADRLEAQGSAVSTLRGLDAETLLQQGKPARRYPSEPAPQAQPNNVRVCYQLGTAIPAAGVCPGSRFYRKALKLNPGFVAARKNRTVLWFQIKGIVGSGISDCVAVTSQRPGLSS
jgi:hypothetical protein